MRNVIVSRTAAAYGVTGALTLAQACTADTLEVEGQSDVPRQTGEYVSPEVPGYPPTGALCSISQDYHRSVPLDEPTSFRFSGHDVLVRFNADAHGALRWADGASTDISFQATWSGADVSYDDSPRDGTYCTPTVRVPLSALQVRTGDGTIDASYVPSDRSGPLNLVGGIDGHGGIGLIFVSQLRLDVDQVDSLLVEEMVAANPEHDNHYVGVKMSLSSTGAKSTCIEGEVISEDPADDCNIYDGVLKFHSVATAGLGNRHNIPAGTFYDAPLAMWLWTE